jgi:hypothetical protein
MVFSGCSGTSNLDVIIKTGHQGSPSVRPAVVSDSSPAAGPAASSAPWKNLVRDWREVTINEAMVEIPQAVLDLSALREHRPTTGSLAQAGVSTLAVLRGVQGLRGQSLEQKLEGVSSLALGVAGTLSMIPGQVAATVATGFMFGQAAAELTLGVRELHEELRLDTTPDWKEIATGTLDTVKGASAFLPIFFPSTSDAVTIVQLAAMVSKATLESTIHRSTEE